MTPDESEPMTTVWQDGQILAFSGLDGWVPYDTGLVATTLAGDDTGLEIRWPAAARIVFPGGRPEQVRLETDAFDALAGERPLCGFLPDAHHLLVYGACRVVACNDALRAEQRAETLLIGVRDHFSPEWLAARTPADVRARLNACHVRCVPPSGLNAAEAAAYRRATAILRGQVGSPEGRLAHRWTTPDRWPHRDMWLWDSAFHAVGWRHVDPSMARDLLSAVFDCQQPDGFIPHQMNPRRHSAVTQPPILAFAALRVHETAPDTGWIAELYPRMVRYLRWDTIHRDTDHDGLLEWSIEPNPECRSGESGMDNSPRFDSATTLAAVDFNAFLAHEYACMAALAPIAGRPADAPRWQQVAAGLRDRINATLWDPSRKFYYDFNPALGRWTDVRACSGFLPLLCGAPDAAMARALAAQLAPGGPFDTPLPVASIAPSDPCFTPDMWRGPSWLNVTWMIAEGLARYGFAEQARHLRDRWMHVLTRECARYGTFFEYYDPLDTVPPTALFRKGKLTPAHPHQVIRDYGWTASLFVDWCHRPDIASPKAEASFP